MPPLEASSIFHTPDTIPGKTCLTLRRGEEPYLLSASA